MEAVQLSVAVPEVLLDVLEDRFETVGVPGAPGAVVPLPLPGICTTVRLYGATVTEAAEVCVVEVMALPLLAKVYTVELPDGVKLL